jgi:hypothetical protein
MRTSMLALVAVAVAPSLGFAQDVSFQTDYGAAQQQAIAQQKPLAVVFGQGANGWQQLAGGTLGEQAARTLADKYVCVYVDTATPAGQAVARKFEMTRPVGLVISDRSGNLQAFWHEGPLAANVLAGYLTKYGDPQRVATGTDINPGPESTQTSYYPPTGPIATNPYLPGLMTGTGPMGGGYIGGGYGGGGYIGGGCGGGYVGGGCGGGGYIGGGCGGGGCGVAYCGGGGGCGRGHCGGHRGGHCGGHRGCR